MASYYYVDKNSKRDGQHHVHTKGCQHLPTLAQRQFLGTFYHSRHAVKVARYYYPQVGSCEDCCQVQLGQV